MEMLVQVEIPEQQVQILVLQAETLQVEILEQLVPLEQLGHLELLGLLDKVEIAEIVEVELLQQIVEPHLQLMAEIQVLLQIVDHLHPQPAHPAQPVQPEVEALPQMLWL